MLLGNHSLLAIMQQWAGPDEERAEHTLQYLYLLLTKVLLNSFMTSFALGSLSHSIMGFCLFLSLSHSITLSPHPPSPHPPTHFCQIIKSVLEPAGSVNTGR